MRWFEVNSPEELKALGKLNAVKVMINRDIKEILGKQKIDTFIKMGSNSWVGVFNKIQDLKKLGVVVAEKNEQALNNQYFINESSKYIY